MQPPTNQPAPADCTALSANYIQPSGFLSCGTDSLELTDRLSFGIFLLILTYLRALLKRHYSHDINASRATEMYA